MLFFFYTRLFQDEDRAQDCLQELFIKVINNIQSFDSQKKFSTWIYTIASNMCKNEYRSNKRNWKKDTGFDMSTLIDISAFGDFSSQYDKDYFVSCLMKELNEMEEEHRRIFLLRHQENLTIEEISEIIGCPEGTVKSRLYYTVRKLAKSLALFNHIEKESYERI